MRRDLNTTASAENSSILLTFDVEDWFQVENFKSYIPRSAWETCELRVDRSTRIILDLLDAAPQAPKATFFILGWVARKLPGLVKEIADRGHEVASHGYGHSLCSTLSPLSLERDLSGSKALLEAICQRQVSGYRAPSFSISDKALDLVKKAGFRYDASFNAFSLNSRYGRLSLDRSQYRRGVYDLGHDFFEVPVSNLPFGPKVIPLGGGGYFRLFPFPLFRLGMKAVLKKTGVFSFYAHPWEFDPDQPRVKAASAGFRFRHYINLDQTLGKLTCLIRSFPGVRFETISQYLDRTGGRV